MTRPSGIRSAWGIAVYLSNQAIYSPSRRAGGPNPRKVSEDRPIRCVLGVAPETESHKIREWLAGMSRTHELRDRQTIALDTAEPGRSPNLERYEVFEFVPRRSPVASVGQGGIELGTAALGDP